MDVIVTYFYEFQIENYNRKKVEYFKRFSTWASKINNSLIIFIQKENEELIKEIRKERLDKTRIIIIDDKIIKDFGIMIGKIKDNILYSHYNTNILFNFFHHKSWEYCFVWMMKIYLINEASKLLQKDDNIIYIDFGLTELKNFNLYPSNFNKTINCDKYDLYKINIFKYNKNLINVPMFELLEYSMGYIYACVIILNVKLCAEFYTKYIEAMNACLLVGFNPVDQDILYLLQKNDNSFYNLIDLDENTKNIVKIVFDIPYKDNTDKYLFYFIKKIYKKVIKFFIIHKYVIKKANRIKSLYK